MLKFNPISGTLDSCPAQTETDPTVPAWAKTPSKPTYTKSEVGLGNAENLAPADMPVSTAAQTALNAKANATDTVNLTGDQTVAGVKTFTSAPIAPSGTSIGGVLYLTGTGFPNGVVAAPVGSIYIDTAVTNGASSWIKKSGTGNTGWSVLWGDTGWRDVSNGVSNGWTGNIYLRRVTNQTIVHFEGMNPSAAANGSVYTIQTGFRPIVPPPIGLNRTFLTTLTGPASTYRLTVNNVGTSTIQNFSTGMGLQYGTLTMVTDQTWPTTLPGTAV